MTAPLHPPDTAPPPPLGRAEAERVLARGYPAGFSTPVATTVLPPGVSEAVVRRISAIKEEPDWLTAWRVAAYHRWRAMRAPDWARLRLAPIDYQAISYYAAPKTPLRSLDEVDPEILAVYERLGVPLHERARLAGVAVEAVFDSVALGTTFRHRLAQAGVLFCSMGEAVRAHPDLVRRYLGSVVPAGDNFFAALNAAVFSDGSFVYVPKGVRCPMELSTYFRINALNTGQFERTLIVCDEDASVSYLEGCSAPMRDTNQLHAAVVELVALDRASIAYATVQNWYPGDVDGRGGIYNFVTKRGDCRGADSRISWTQLETGSAITWKYPSCVLRGARSHGSFHSVALTHHHQQADTGTKMIHIGEGTTSTIVAKGISAGQSSNRYRGLVRVGPHAVGARNRSQCDSLLIGSRCAAHTYPSVEVRHPSGIVEHEATTSKISDDQLFYCRSRGLAGADAVGLIVNGFCKDVVQKLPMEFAVEAKRLLDVSLEGAVG